MQPKPLRVSTGQRISKTESGRILQRALDRLDGDQLLAVLHGETPDGWAELIEDEATRTVVPNRAARRAFLRSRRLNVKQADKRRAYLERAGRRRQKAIDAARRQKVLTAAYAAPA